MSGSFKKWGQNLNDETKQSAWAHAKESAAQGLFDAREDIRQKLVDEGWTGRFQPDAKVDLYGNAAAPEPDASPDIASSDLYGETPEMEPEADIHGNEPEP